MQFNLCNCNYAKVKYDRHFFLYIHFCSITLLTGHQLSCYVLVTN